MKIREVGGVPGNVLGMLADLALKLQHGVITPRQFGKFLKKEKYPFVVKDYSGYSDREIIADWQAFYLGLGVKCDLSNVVIPKDPGGFVRDPVGFSRVIIMAKGITPQSAYDLGVRKYGKLPCQKQRNVDLDTIITSDRTTKDGPYAIRVYYHVEELENYFDDDLIKRRDVVCTTLEEEEIFGLKYYETDGIIRFSMLCAGSHCSDGTVPIVHCDCAGLKVILDNFRGDDREKLHFNRVVV